MSTAYLLISFLVGLCLFLRTFRDPLGDMIDDFGNRVEAFWEKKIGPSKDPNAMLSPAAHVAGVHVLVLFALIVFIWPILAAYYMWKLEVEE